MIDFGPAVVDSSKLTPEQLKRREHGLSVHGRDFWMKETHKIEHQRSRRAIEILKDGDALGVDVTYWIGEITLIAHEHEGDDY